jgi:GNAT superfamily N-acetyltransferase
MLTLRSRYVRPLGHTAGMTFTTRMLTPETWDDFAALVEASNGVWGGCWCMGFHPEGVGAGHTREGNREAKRRHVTRGTVRQVLVYDGDRCVGWCQFGSPPELPNINNRRTYDQGAGDPPDWRIGCIFTNAKDRGKGVAAAAVAAALDEIKRAGGGVVEAYPEQTEQRPPQRGAYLHTGPEELYAQYGFTRVRKIAKWRWVMRTKI